MGLYINSHLLLEEASLIDWTLDKALICISEHQFIDFYFIYLFFGSTLGVWVSSF